MEQQYIQLVSSKTTCGELLYHGVVLAGVLLLSVFLPFDCFPFDHYHQCSSLCLVHLLPVAQSELSLVVEGLWQCRKYGGLVVPLFHTIFLRNQQHQLEYLFGLLSHHGSRLLDIVLHDGICGCDGIAFVPQGSLLPCKGQTGLCIVIIGSGRRP